MSRCDATYVWRGVVVKRGNRLSGTVGSVRKPVIMHELVKRL
jgi:hypothetical protein